MFSLQLVLERESLTSWTLVQMCIRLVVEEQHKDEEDVLYLR